MKFLTLCGCVLGLVCLALSAETENARLLASKNILNQYLVEDKDLTVQYDIYNIGGSSALNTELTDKSFPDVDFDVVRGSLSVQWQRIGPGSNVSHVVILKPKRSGYFNFTSAELSYQPSEAASDRQHAYTSAPGEGGIVNFKDYDRKFSPHMADPPAKNRDMKVMKQFRVPKICPAICGSGRVAFTNVTKLDWAAFAVMTLPSLGIPFLLWHSSKSKYEQKQKKN